MPQEDMVSTCKRADDGESRHKARHISLPTCGCLFLKIVVHSLRRCSGFSLPSLVVTLLVPVPAPFVDRELWDGATCTRRDPFEGCAGMNDVEL